MNSKDGDMLLKLLKLGSVVLIKHLGGCLTRNWKTGRIWLPTLVMFECLLLKKSGSVVLKYIEM